MPDGVRVLLISVEVDIAFMLKVHFTDELVENDAVIRCERTSLKYG